MHHTLFPNQQNLTAYNANVKQSNFLQVQKCNFFLNTVDKQIIFCNSNVSTKLLQSGLETHLWIWGVKCTKIPIDNCYFSKIEKLNIEV